MSRHLLTTCLAFGFTLLLAVGCAPTQPFYFFESGDLKHYIGMATTIEQPDTKQAGLTEVCDPPPPLSLSNSHYDSIWELPLQEAIHITLENSKVMRTLGARFATTGGSRPQVGDAPTVLLSNSTGVPTVYDPALIESNPNTGVEGAASAYDALFASSIEWDHEHVPQNINPAFAFQNGVLTQDVDTFTAGITKRTESGGIVSITNTDTYTDSNNPSLGLSHDNQAVVDLGFQQRLLRGGGTFFNQIHGPLDFNQTGIGQNFDGVVIARINMDIGLADFESGVRNLVNDVENAYWELYFAYRALDAAKVGRDSALETWKKIYALYIVAARGGEADKEAQSREQYFTFRAQVEQALTDLYRIENRLRYLMGLAATDGRLIRPKDEPTTAHVVFDWCDVHSEGLARSVELRKEKWRIKQLELELMASKNLLLPNLDFNGHYRFFGLGDDLNNPNGTAFTGTNSIVGTDATSTLTTGQFATWTFGLNFSQEIGNRRNLGTIRNQQLQLTRERCVLQDQELELSHEISDAVRNLDTQYRLMQTNFNVRVASQQEVAAIEVAYQAGTVTLDLLLQAQQRRSAAEAAYYRSLIDYNRAIAQIHYVKGSLLEYNDVYLAEGPWPCKAYFDARRHARERDAGKYLDYGYTRPDTFSQGQYQQFADRGAMGPGQPMQGNQQPAESIIAPKPQSKPQSNPLGPNSPRTSGGSSSNILPEGRPADDNPADGDQDAPQAPSSVRKPRVLRGDSPTLGSTAPGGNDTGNPSSSRSDDLGGLMTARPAGANGSDDSNNGPSLGQPARGADGWQSR